MSKKTALIACIGVFAAGSWIAGLGESDETTTSSIPATTTEAVAPEPTVDDPAQPDSEESIAQPPPEQPAGVYQPVVENHSEEGQPYWSTTFGVVLPAGQWEQPASGEYDCHPIDEGSWALTNLEGQLITWFDRGQTIAFGRTDSQIDGDTCRLIAVIVGDYTVLSTSYTLSNGQVAATYSGPELFSGQDDGPNHMATTS